MSRIGKKPIPVPTGVEVKLSGKLVSVKGPLGTLSRPIPGAIVKIEPGVVNVLRDEELPNGDAMHGLSRTLVANMVEGVSKGFSKTLVITGTGYKVEAGGRGLILSLGYSNPVDFELPASVKATVAEKNLKVTLTSIDKEVLGDVTAKIRALRPVEPYKGKGVAYENEVVRRKAGKAGAK
ncbi:MAG TPA: 50S ribosomal protein L6 [Myxococcota bacterium]|nr:50S ribosomal protein L6 [Myxococcota bacterium]HOA13012.1 50S ribosomal protein L6 [Myxococcota bacterium]HOC98814.1 50S ribosomal protein L6 [Myxococcota bacterium]HOH75867.1 50S ribosomal protein L6 [Myxococcota bacterium]HPV03236.1 50S ribosomal protein L6 [Myxococcota bacterium]